MARPSTAAVRLLTGEREPCRLATTANITLSGLQTIDAVLTEVADRVLVKNQTDATKNGIYTASEGVWYRASDARSSRTMQKGTTVHIQQGTVNAGTVYAFQTFEPDIGTDNIVLGFYTSDDIEGDASAIFAAAAQYWIDIIGTYTFGVGNHVYNAVSEGLADNSGITSAKAALQTALNAATAVGKPLWIPKGTYKFNAGEYLNPPTGAVIIGAPGATFRKVTDEAIPLIYVPSGNPSKIRIKGLTFEYTAGTTAVTGGANAAIYLIGCKDVIVEDCLATGPFYVAFNISEGSEYTFKDCKAYGFVNRGFYINAGQGGTTSGTLNHVKVLDCVADGLDGGAASNIGRYGFNTNAFGTGFAGNILFQGCFALGVYGHGISASERCGNVRIVDCHVQTTSVDCVGIIVQFANAFRATRNLVEGCTVTGGFNGIVVTEADYTQIIGCSAWSCVNDGFYIYNSLYVSCVDCHSISNGGRGFDIDASGAGLTTRASFVGCVAAGNTGWGFFAVANATYPRVTNCDSVLNTAGTISLAAGTAITANNS